MNYALLIIRGSIIGFISFEVNRLIYLYSTSKAYVSNSNLTISYAPFPLSILDFVIPVAILAIITRKWFSSDKLLLPSIGEGLTIASIYLALVFVLDLFNLFIGWVIVGEWGSGYFILLPVFSAYTILNLIIIPCVVLAIRGLIERPVFNKLEDQFKPIMK